MVPAARLTLICAVVGALAFASTAAGAQRLGELPDAQVREQIIKDSIAAYKATGHPCACPDDLARNGSRCGGRSAYSRPGGATPLCYLKDVSDEMVRQWRRTHKLVTQVYGSAECGLLFTL